jgi:DNA segregation ATPase FtsK/SpoIIIE-like protein
VILDSVGAEKLLGKGDALLLQDGQNVRIQVLLKDPDYDAALRKKCTSARPSVATSVVEAMEVLPDWWEEPGSTREYGSQDLEATEVLPTFLAEYLQFNPSATLETVADRAREIMKTGSRSKAIKDIFGLTGGRRYPEASAALDYLLSLPE